jgi:uncharacterized membrane protein
LFCKLLSVVLGGFLLALALMAPAILGLVFPGIGMSLLQQRGDLSAALVLVALWYATVLSAALYLGARLGMFIYLAVDRDSGPIEAVRGSWELTRGRAATIMSIFMIAGLINLAGMLACLVGFVLTIPFTVLVLTVTYLALPKDEG